MCCLWVTPRDSVCASRRVLFKVWRRWILQLQQQNLMSFHFLLGEFSSWCWYKPWLFPPWPRCPHWSRKERRWWDKPAAPSSPASPTLDFLLVSTDFRTQTYLWICLSFYNPPHSVNTHMTLYWILFISLLLLDVKFLLKFLKVPWLKDHTYVYSFSVISVWIIWIRRK